MSDNMSGEIYVVAYVSMYKDNYQKKTTYNTRIMFVIAEDDYEAELLFKKWAKENEIHIKKGSIEILYFEDCMREVVGKTVTEVDLSNQFELVNKNDKSDKCKIDDSCSDEEAL